MDHLLLLPDSSHLQNVLEKSKHKWEFEVCSSYHQNAYLHVVDAVAKAHLNNVHSHDCKDEQHIHYNLVCFYYKMPSIAGQRIEGEGLVKVDVRLRVSLLHLVARKVSFQDHPVVDSLHYDIEKH
jgi:hypothetical protein